MKFVIVGCGRVGSQLANNLYVEGHDVSIIDKNPKAFRRFSPAFKGDMVPGIGFDRDVLLEAGIEKADGFASVTNGDNSNIISALIAKRVFQVPRIITRIYDPLRANIYKKFGIPTISSTIWGANQIREHLVYTRLMSEQSFGSGEAQLVAVKATHLLAGRSVADISIPGQILITCIVRLGSAMVPTDVSVFEQGDLIYACVANESLSRFNELTGY